LRPSFNFFLTMILCAALQFACADASAYTLEIFGNANMDDTIDENDIAYVEGIIKGSNIQTDLSDANYDGLVDADDIDQIQKIIDGSESEITIVDAQKRNVTLTVPIKKAVAVNTGALEIIRAIGVDVDDVFVGVSSYAIANSLYWPELKDKVSIAYGNPDYEQLAQMKPDLVILYKNPKKDESFDNYQAIGVPVVCMDCFNQEEMDGSIKIFGELFNKRSEADGLIEWYHGYVDLVQERTDGLSASDRPKTLFYNYPESNYPALKVSNSKSGEHTMIVKAGGINIAEDLNSSSGVAETDREWLLSENPDIIISNVVAGETKSGYSADDTAINYMKMVRDMLLNDSAIDSTTAGKNGRIFIICTDLNRGPMQAAGTVVMAKFLHPELFEDLDPHNILKEYYETWQGIPYRGIYIYPFAQ
jgi:iron complex transport system substrate-binding protein